MGGNVPGLLPLIWADLKYVVSKVILSGSYLDTISSLGHLPFPFPLNTSYWIFLDIAFTHLVS